MLIVILIGTVQLGRFVRGLLESSEKKEKDGRSNYPVQVIGRVGSAIRSLLGMDSKMGSISSSSGTPGTTM